MHFTVDSRSVPASSSPSGTSRDLWIWSTQRARPWSWCLLGSGCLSPAWIQRSNVLSSRESTRSAAASSASGVAVVIAFTMMPTRSL